MLERGNESVEGGGRDSLLVPMLQRGNESAEDGGRDPLLVPMLQHGNAYWKAVWEEADTNSDELMLRTS